MFITAFSSAFLANYTTAGRLYNVGTYPSAPSLKIQNNSPRGVSLLVGGNVIDYIPPFFYMICDNYQGLSLELDDSVSYSYLPLNASVTITTLDAVQPYQLGQMINISSITGTVDANIQNASISTQVVNELLSTGSGVVVSQTFNVSMTAGGNQWVSVPLGVLSRFDEITVMIDSPAGIIGNTALYPSQVQLAMGPGYLPDETSARPVGSSYLVTTQTMGAKYYMSKPTPVGFLGYGDTVQVNLVNGGSSSLIDGALKVTILAHYSTTSINTKAIQSEEALLLTSANFTVASLSAGATSANLGSVGWIDLTAQYPIKRIYCRVEITGTKTAGVDLILQPVFENTGASPYLLQSGGMVSSSSVEIVGNYAWFDSTHFPSMLICNQLSFAVYLKNTTGVAIANPVVNGVNLYCDVYW